MITFSLIDADIIYDTTIVTSLLFRKSFNCRYNPRMDYVFCLLTLKSSEKWWSPYIIWCYKHLQSPNSTLWLVRDSSVVRRHYILLLEPSNVRAQYIRKTADLPHPALGRHISTFRGYRIFINYQKPLYKSLHQSFFYSFITILPSESGVTLHYSTILP